MLARSEDNLTGKESTCTTFSLHVLLIIGLNPPDSIPRSSAILSRHSLYTWLHKELEGEDMASSRVGRKQSNKQRSHEEMPVVPSVSLHTIRVMSMSGLSSLVVMSR